MTKIRGSKHVAPPLHYEGSRTDINTDPKSDVAVGNNHTKGHKPEQRSSQTSQMELPSLLSPQLKKERNLLVKSIPQIELLFIVIVLGILSLYWGDLASFLPDQKFPTVALVGFDGGEVSKALTQFGSSSFLKYC